MLLLESRGLAGEWAGGRNIYAKRPDGSTLPMAVEPEEAIQVFEQRVTELTVSSLSQAPVGDFWQGLLGHTGSHGILPWWPPASSALADPTTHSSALLRPPSADPNAVAPSYACRGKRRRP